MKALSFNNINANGTFGDGSKAHLYHYVSAATVGTVIRLGKFNPGTRIDLVRAINAAMGASVTLEFGVTFPDADGTDDTDVFIPATAASSAGATTSETVAPITYDKYIELVCKVTGATATGRLDVVVDYNYQGL